MQKEWSKEVFSKNLQFQMERFGKSQKEMAEIVGVTAPTFHEWVKGKKYPRIDKIQKLADYFGILKSDLIEEKIADAIEDRPEEMAAHHFEMIMDEDMNEIYKDFKGLNEQERQLIKDLVRSMAERKKTEA